jgi:hypothetical protein
MALVAGKPIKARRVRDPIAELHSAALEGLSACPVDQTAPKPIVAPPAIPGLQGDDYPLEYYEDGYPKLPSCLDRRA